MQLNKDEAFARIDRKLALLFGGVVFVLILIASLVVYTYYQRLIVAEEDRLSTVITQIVSHAIERISFAGKYHSQLLVEEIAEGNPEVAFIIVTDDAHTILAHSDPAKRKLTLSPELSADAVEAMQKGVAVVSDMTLGQHLIKHIAVPFRSGYLGERNGVIHVGIDTHAQRAAANSGLVYISGLIALLMVVSIVLIYQISRAIGRPVKTTASQLKGILHHAPLMITIHDADGRLIETSDLFLNAFRIDLQAWKGKRMEELLPPEDARHFYDSKWATREEDGIIHADACFVIGDQHRYFLIKRFAIESDEHGRPLQFCNAALDVTEIEETRRQLELAREGLEERVKARTLELSRTNERLREEIGQRKAVEESLKTQRDFAESLIDTAQVIILVLDPEGRIVRFNNYLETLSGYTQEEVRGCDWFEVFLPVRDHAALRELFQKAISGVSTQGNANPIVAKNGEERVIEWYDTRLHDTAGRVIGLLAIGQDVTERYSAEQALRETTEKAEQASRAKTEFLSRMSHELRTPMNAVLGFAQLMDSDEELPPLYREYVHEILVAGNHLTELINEVLDLSRIEAGRYRLDLQQIDFAAIYREAVVLLMPMLEKTGITLKDNMSDQSLLIRADKMCVRQVLLNLLSNAVKYNQPEGRVTVSAHPTENGWLHVDVHDTGRGISREDMDRLFEPFTRFGDDEAGIEGTGIGLAITKRLMALMNGRIGVESESGAGSRFWIELPLESGSMVHMPESEAAD